jgi:hypothetical protein
VHSATWPEISSPPPTVLGNKSREKLGTLTVSAYSRTVCATTADSPDREPSGLWAGPSAMPFLASNNMQINAVSAKWVSKFECVDLAHGGSIVNLISVLYLRVGEKTMLLVALNMFPTLQPLMDHFTDYLPNIFSSDRFTPARESIGIILLENQLSELENHGAKLYQTDP